MYPITTATRMTATTTPRIPRTQRIEAPYRCGVASGAARGERIVVRPPRFHLFTGSRGEELKTSESVAAVSRGEAREHIADEPRLEDFLRGAQPLSGTRQ